MLRHRLVLPFLVLGLAATAMAAEKPEVWVEVRSPHFTVYSNAGQKQAQRVAEQFEQIRAMFAKAFPNVKVDPGQPMYILAAKNEKTLKTLLPGFWERKGQAHPVGLFVPGQEKNYAALRLDTQGDNPFQTIYHEYVHLLVRLNYQGLPTWLNEGLAEFWANTIIGDKTVRTGRPDENHILLLRESKLLPIEVLLKVDHGSPYYNEANKVSIFYAQSWALVSYLMLDEKMRQGKALTRFLQAVNSGKDDTEAAREAFGELKKLEKTLESYVRSSRFYELEIKKPAEIPDSEYTVRTVPEAESAALRGDFHMHTNRPVEARALLEQALKLDPKLALAHESFGFVYFRENNREEAARWFAQAAQLDSQSALAHYFHAMLQMQESLDPEKFGEVEVSLRRSIELNPDFAPAYVTISGFYAMREETKEKAVEAARKAYQLQPGEMMYAFNLAQILLRTDHVDEAGKLTQQLLVRPQSEQQRTLAMRLLEDVRTYQEHAAAKKRYEEEQRAAEEAARRAQTEPARESPAAGGNEGPRPGLNRRGGPPPRAEDSPTMPSGGTGGVSYGMFGKIAEVVCEQPAEMYLTLTMHSITMKLHATNYFKIEYLTTRWQPPPKFNPCVHLKGLTAKVSYKLVQGQTYDGEITSIEVQR